MIDVFVYEGWPNVTYEEWSGQSPLFCDDSNTWAGEADSHIDALLQEFGLDKDSAKLQQDSLADVVRDCLDDVQATINTWQSINESKKVAFMQSVSQIAATIGVQLAVDNLLPFL